MLSGVGPGSFVWLVTDAHGLLRAVATYCASGLLVEERRLVTNGIEFRGIYQG
jgi:hypothetical protein